VCLICSYFRHPGTCELKIPDEPSIRLAHKTKIEYRIETVEIQQVLHIVEAVPE
jgi:hypothetical protein